MCLNRYTSSVYCYAHCKSTQATEIKYLSRELKKKKRRKQNRIRFKIRSTATERGVLG